MKTDLGTCELCARRKAFTVAVDRFPCENAEPFDDGRFRICRSCFPGWLRTQARLRLENAAGALLEAAKGAVAFLEDVDGETTEWEPVVKALRAAIEKAETREGGAA